MNRMIYFIAILVAILRLFITPRLQNVPTFELSYEAFAHIFVGFLIGVAYAAYHFSKRFYYEPKVKNPYGPYSERYHQNFSVVKYAGVAFAISLWELVIFIIQKVAAD